ncbi:hypothetical protein E2C01_060012 [Portunus trituberculatus]|uniref:Uncharacterized protein n=1 Tax=Portunus trituberculatus TaxID=210409 RepID=A0A5B7H861_PORTR|nr:hypothetical protein [Portunus trituberculatus]
MTQSRCPGTARLYQRNLLVFASPAAPGQVRSFCFRSVARENELLTSGWMSAFLEKIYKSRFVCAFRRRKSCTLEQILAGRRRGVAWDGAVSDSGVFRNAMLSHYDCFSKATDDDVYTLR